MTLNITPMESFDYSNKTVILRLDINSPLDGEGRIKNDNRLDMSLGTLQSLASQGAKVAIIAHQGDTLDYHNMAPLAEHAEKLTQKLGRPVDYIDDPCGPAAQAAVKNLKPGGIVILGNLRYLSEEMSSFEDVVKLEPKQMLDTYLVRSLAPLADYYVNDAFAAAHRNAPSMVAFQELLPSAAGELFFKEIFALNQVMNKPEKPSVFVLGGAKISDAFGMLEQVLSSGSADAILTGGVTANVFLQASGVELGARNEKFLKDTSLDAFLAPAKKYLTQYPGKIHMPQDLAFESNGQRVEVSVSASMPPELYIDLGQKTVESYSKVLETAGTIFVNGPAGMYEKPGFELGTKSLWEAIAKARGYSVIGGGDTVSVAQTFIDTKKINYVCTAGGAMVRYLSGKKLPLIEAMENAWKRSKESK